MKQVTKEILDWLLLDRGDRTLGSFQERKTVQHDLSVNIKHPSSIVENHCRQFLPSNQESVVEKFFPTKKTCIEYVIRQTKLIGLPDVVEIHLLRHQSSPYDDPPSFFKFRRSF
jgi:hypothetical protein